MIKNITIIYASEMVIFCPKSSCLEGNVYVYIWSYTKLKLLWIDEVSFCAHAFTYSSFYLFQKYLLSTCYIYSRYYANSVNTVRAGTDWSLSSWGLWCDSPRRNNEDLKIIQGPCKTRQKPLLFIQKKYYLFCWGWRFEVKEFPGSRTSRVRYWIYWWFKL